MKKPRSAEASAGQMRGSAAKYGCHPEKLKNRY